MSENNDLYDIDQKIEKLEKKILNLEDNIENYRSISIESLTIAIRLLDIMKKQNEGSLSIVESIKNLADMVIK